MDVPREANYPDGDADIRPPRIIRRRFGPEMRVLKLAVCNGRIQREIS